MDADTWRTFLSTWSEEILRYSDEHYLRGLPLHAKTSGWLGYAGATEAQLAAAEARLGRSLPPSYRAFLAVSNGWRRTTPFIDAVWPTEQIEWLSVASPEFLPAWMEGVTAFGVPEPIPDADYFVYGGAQREYAIRHEYFETALQISAWGDAAVYLLNPQVVTPAGEWEAWFFASWLPGARRYRTFWDLMRAEHDSFLALARH